MLLGGDIGGTKTNLAIFSPQAGPWEPIAKATFPSGRYASLEVMVQEFLSGTDLRPIQASFGVAGPVVNGRSSITNLRWELDERQLAISLKLESVRLLNDLDAIAHAVPFLRPADLHTLNQGSPVLHGNIAVAAPGTGLGEAFLTWDGGRYRAHATEGGHTDFAPRNRLQIDLLAYWQDKLGHVSVERVCSGRGIPNIYGFLRESGYAPEPDWLAAALQATADPTPVIVNAALDKERPCPLCQTTLDTFISILGAKAGNFALKIFATGGVYLGGGIPPRILPELEKGLMDNFKHKGRFAHLMDQMPVHVILNPKVALFGAACHGLEPEARNQ